MIVYSNSCTFGAPQEHPTYADYFAKYLSAELVNRGMPGSCNRRIIRRSIRDLAELAKTQKQIVALIGLTFVFRTELWQTDMEANDNDGHFHPVMVDYKKIDWSIKGIIDTHVPNIYQYAKTSVKDYYKEWLIHFHPESAVTDLVTDLLMFAGWAKSHDISFLIFSNVDVFPGPEKVDQNSPFLKSLVDNLLNIPGMIDPWNFSFGTYVRQLGYEPKDANLYGQHGHPNRQAHEKFSDFLIAEYNNIYAQ